ncbi:MAG: hypothetical protein LBF81_00160 [Prevotellaceae bacterium]|jgi:hypothetical protein|nr:hypothetical protein [Prevotellaceae bacterium]
MGGIKGKTNNKNGRPPGAVNKLARAHKERLSGLLAEKYQIFTRRLEELEAKDFVKAYIDLLKYVVPPAQPAQEATPHDRNSALKERIMEASKTTAGKQPEKATANECRKQRKTTKNKQNAKTA